MLLNLTKMLCVTLHCSAVLYFTTLHCSALQCTAVQFSAVQCSAVQCSTLQCTAVQCSAVQCSAKHCTIHRGQLWLHFLQLCGRGHHVELEATSWASTYGLERNCFLRPTNWLVFLCCTHNLITSLFLES